MTMQTVLQSANAMIDEAIRMAKEVLKPGLRDFLKEHPRIKAIRWTQFAPHFNDGEACVFNFNGLEAAFGDAPLPKSGEDEDEDGDSRRWQDVGFPDGDVKEEYEPEFVALKELNKLLRDSEDALEALFGDGVQVTATRKGVAVDEYDHD